MTTQKNIAAFLIKHLFLWSVLCIGNLHGASEFPVNATINNGTFTVNQGGGEYPTLNGGWMAFPSKIENYQTVISRGKATVTFNVQRGDTNILRDIHVAFAGGSSSGSYYAGGISACTAGWGNLTSVVRRGTYPQDLAYYNTGGEKVTVDKIGTNTVPVLKYASLSSIIYDFRVTVNSTDKYLLVEVKINPNTPATTKSATKAADQLYSPLFLYRTTGTEIPDNLGYVAFTSWDNRLVYQNITTSAAIDPIALYDAALAAAKNAVTGKTSSLNAATTSTQINAITDTDASITTLTDALTAAAANRTMLAALAAYTDADSTTLIASLNTAWANLKTRKANLPVDDLRAADDAVKKQTTDLNAATDANRQSLIDSTQAIIDTFKTKNNALTGNATAIAAAGVLYNADYTQQANIVLLTAARNAAKTATVTTITSKITAFTDAISGSLKALQAAITGNATPSITTQNALALAVTAASTNLTALNTLLTTGAAKPSAVSAAITVNTATPADNAILTSTVAAANSLLGNALKGIDTAITGLTGRLAATPPDNTALSDANAYASTLIAALNTAYSALAGNSAAQTIAGTAYTSYTSATVNNGATLTIKTTAAQNAFNSGLVSALQTADAEVTGLTGRFDAAATAAGAYSEAIAIPSTPTGNTLTAAALKSKALQDANDALKTNQDAIKLAGTLYSTDAVHPHAKALSERLSAVLQKAQDLLKALGKADADAAIPLIGTVAKATPAVITALNGLTATTENVAATLQTNLTAAFPTAADKTAFLAAYATAAAVTGTTTQADSLIVALQKAIDDVNAYAAAKAEATKANTQGSTALSSAQKSLTDLQTAWGNAKKLKAALDLQVVAKLSDADKVVTELTGRLNAADTATAAYDEAVKVPTTPAGNTLTAAALKNKALQDANDALKTNQDAITLAGTLYSTEAVHPHAKALNDRLGEIQQAQVDAAQKAQDLLRALSKADAAAAISLVGTVAKATPAVITALNGLTATTENVAATLQTNLTAAFPTAADKTAFLAAYATAAAATGAITQADSLIAALQKAIDDVNATAKATGTTALGAAQQTLSALQTAWTNAQKLKAALDLQVTVNNQVLVAKLSDADKVVTELTGRLNAADTATAAYDEAVKVPTTPAGNTLTAAALKNKALQDANDALKTNQDAITLAGTLYSTETVHPHAKALNDRLGEIQQAKIGATQNVQRLLQELGKADAAAAIPLVGAVAKADTASPTAADKAAFLAAYATAAAVTGATTLADSLVAALQKAIDDVNANETAKTQGSTALGNAQQSLTALQTAWTKAKTLKAAFDQQPSIPTPGTSSGSGLGNSSPGGLGAGSTGLGTTGLSNTPSTGTGSSSTGSGTGSLSSAGGSNTNNDSTRGSSTSGSGLGLGTGSTGGLGLGSGLGSTPRTDQQLAADLISANGAIVTYTKTVKNPLTKSVANTKAKLLKDALTKAMTAIKGKTNAIKSAGAAYSTKNPHPSIAALDAAIKKLKS